MNIYLYFLIIAIAIIVEPLPISSSAHVSFFVNILQRVGYTISKNIVGILDELAHGVNVLVLLFFFRNRWMIIVQNPPLWKKIIITLFCADSITVLLYAFWKIVGTAWFPLWLGSLITGLLLYSLRWCRKPSLQTLTIKNSVLLGVVQGFALLPGISRFGSTFAIARWLGFSSKKAFEVSFLIEWPISCAAFLKGLISFKQLTISDLLLPWLPLLMLIAGIVAYCLFSVMHYLVVRNKTWLFSLYLFFFAALVFFIK